MKIVILDGDTISPGIWKYDQFEEFGEVTAYRSTPPELVAERIGDAEFVCTDGSQIDKEVLDKCTCLKWIGVVATGYDKVDAAYAREKGIVVCNAPAYATQSVSQHSFALLFHLCHHLKAYSEAVREGRWNAFFWEYPIIELKGKTMGIFGFGEIAKNSAKIAGALGMNVLISTGHPDFSFETPNIKFAEKADVLEKADIINLHCPLREDNFRFINRDSIARMKDGVILINTARGALINEDDLAEALTNGKVAAAGLDVLSEEPSTGDNPLIGLNNCIVTPHIGYNSAEAREKLIEITINNLKGFLRGEFLNRVN
ncbi:MAG: D-2-hydroxyacid dehydrogenase [Eubacteriales bacterium]|nr:D-2-hydroxyacid dehydrogenase [Eubacteriales bacterium]MDD3199122.1 D-2-hydroxyacid dehydrogenase [Eubacteriales bacterium]MDD4629635.1 D-2-hydroxyacid dehydrogenase [Eubacteriales bacterium]